MSGNYSLTHTVDNLGALTFTCSNTDSCEEDSCIIDMTFGLQILAYLQANPSFTPTVTGANECLAEPGQNGQVLQRTCSGTAPNLEFQVVII